MPSLQCAIFGTWWGWVNCNRIFSVYSSTSPKVAHHPSLKINDFGHFVMLLYTVSSPDVIKKKNKSQPKNKKGVDDFACSLALSLQIWKLHTFFRRHSFFSVWCLINLKSRILVYRVFGWWIPSIMRQKYKSSQLQNVVPRIAYSSWSCKCIILEKKLLSLGALFLVKNV